MAKRPTINTLTNTASPTYLTQLNQNFTNVRNQFDNTLSLDGSTPNAMNADIDLNGNDLINAGSVNTATLRIGGRVVSPSETVVVDSVAVKKEFDTVALLLADTDTYTNYTTGDYFRVVNGGFVYQVAASGATNHHVTTAGGVKLYQVGQPQQWNLVGKPASVSVAVSASAGVLNGTYYWSVSYVTAEGETEVSVGVAASPASKQVDVTIPVSPDSRVIARKIYRTVAGAIESQQSKLVATINDNVTTAYTDNVADGSLGAPAPHTNTSAGKILSGSDVIASLSSGATTYGVGAMPTGQGYACTAIGAQALENNVGGYRNTAVGTNALDANTTGYNNTAVGVHALDSGTTGNDNTAVGMASLFYYNGTASVAVGAYAGGQITSGDNNTFVGAAAGQLRTGGGGNTLVGQQAGYAAGNGTQNTGVGQAALQSMVGANFNTAVGFGAAGSVTSGSFNTALGWGALGACVTAGNNIAIGPFAGQFETDGNHLWIDSFGRSNLADAKVKSLIYGEFWIDRAGQKIDFNGQVNPLAGLGMPGRTVTADGAVTVDDTVLTCNKAGTLTLTLPTGKEDKVLILRNWTANTVVSASANVQPIGGGADGTAILPATSGSWAFLRCRAGGTAWEIVMRG